MRASTEVVLNETLPRILLNDALNMPDKLCMAPTHIMSGMIMKAKKYLAEADRYIRFAPMCTSHEVHLVLRFTGCWDHFTKQRMINYLRTIRGRPPSSFEDYVEGTTNKELLMALISVCQSMHMVMKLHTDGSHGVAVCKLNPLGLSCTCKGYRMVGICAHVIAVTCIRCDEESYNEAFLDNLLAQLVKKKKASHRPRKTARARQKQPHGDSDSDEVEPEEWDNDLDAL